MLKIGSPLRECSDNRVTAPHVLASGIWDGTGQSNRQNEVRSNGLTRTRSQPPSIVRRGTKCLVNQLVADRSVVASIPILEQTYPTGRPSVLLRTIGRSVSRPSFCRNLYLLRTRRVSRDQHSRVGRLSQFCLRWPIGRPNLFPVLLSKIDLTFFTCRSRHRTRPCRSTRHSRVRAGWAYMRILSSRLTLWSDGYWTQSSRAARRIGRLLYLPATTAVHHTLVPLT